MKSGNKTPGARLRIVLEPDILDGIRQTGAAHQGIAAVIVVAVGLSWSIPAALAGEAIVAVAANFAAPVKEIASLFEAASGDRVTFSFASTGTLYTQISQGAPFDVLLAADQARPQKAIDEGLAVAGSRFTYATGKIVLFSQDRDLVQGEKTLRDGKFAKIAIANPITAPYGAAAVEAMKALGVYDSLAGKFVQGSNIAQTYQFVATGNAEVGFVALSQIALNSEGSRWIVPDDLYSAIAQDAVLLKHGAENGAARAFLTFMKGQQARAVTAKYGYGSGN
jgi:molybdate transport system substrate-binding protein